MLEWISKEVWIRNLNTDSSQVSTMIKIQLFQHQNWDTTKYVNRIVACKDDWNWKGYASQDYKTPAYDYRNIL